MHVHTFYYLDNQECWESKAAENLLNAKLILLKVQYNKLLLNLSLMVLQKNFLSVLETLKTNNCSALKQ